MKQCEVISKLSLAIFIFLNFCFIKPVMALKQNQQYDNRKPVKFSDDYLGDGNKCSDATGFWDNLHCFLIDPPANPGILKLGADIKYDPLKYEIDPTKYGFLCQFSADSNCPADPITSETVAQFGKPREGTIFTVNFTPGRVILNYDMTNNPAPSAFNDTFFFGFGFRPLTQKPIRTDDFVQQTNNQYCITTDNKYCSTVPEPLTVLGSITALSIGAFFKRKFKMYKSTK